MRAATAESKADRVRSAFLFTLKIHSFTPNVLKKQKVKDMM